MNLDRLIAEIETAIACGEHDRARELFAAVITKQRGPDSRLDGLWKVLEREGALLGLKEVRR